VRELVLRLAIAILALAAANDAAAQLFSRFAASHWVDSDDRTTGLDAFKGRLLVMTMAYTECRKTCSSSMLIMRQIQDILARRGLDASFVVVSYDPDRDSPSQWRRYRALRKLPGNWHFLSGPVDDTRQLASFLELKYWPYDDHVMHDFRIVIFDAGGHRLRDILWESSAHLEQELAGL
jgi:protein SCO1/2